MTVDRLRRVDEFDFVTKGVTADVVDEHGNTLISPSHKTKRQAGKYFVHLLKLAIKHIGLTLLLMGYLLAGSYLFQTLEVDNEVKECNSKMHSYFNILNSSTLRILGTVKSTDSSQRAEELVQNILFTFAKDMHALDFNPSTHCDVISQWTFLNSLVFCVTVTTTIGYGHIVPSTNWGRLSCIIYAVIGIPLMLIYLAIIGNLLARGFRFIFLNIICFRCFYDKIRQKKKKQRERLLKWEEDLREHEEEEARRRGLPLPPRKVQPTVVDEDEDLEDEFLQATREKLSVPLTISFVVLICCTSFGAVIFPIWEDWSTIKSLYFAFTSLSTIGFGDVVPGLGHIGEPQTTVELIFGGLYILVGLSLLSMCLNLMKDELVAKAQYIAKLFGIAERNEAESKTHGTEIDVTEKNPELDTPDQHPKDSDPTDDKGFIRELEFDNKGFQIE